jgi:hypothetical protein
MKKHHWHVFRHEKLFEKQQLPHCQTPLVDEKNSRSFKMEGKGMDINVNENSPMTQKKKTPN